MILKNGLSTFPGPQQHPGGFNSFQLPNRDVVGTGHCICSLWPGDRQRYCVDAGGNIGVEGVGLGAGEPISKAPQACVVGAARGIGESHRQWSCAVGGKGDKVRHGWQWFCNCDHIRVGQCIRPT